MSRWDVLVSAVGCSSRPDRGRTGTNKVIGLRPAAAVKRARRQQDEPEPSSTSSAPTRLQARANAAYSIEKTRHLQSYRDPVAAAKLRAWRVLVVGSRSPMGSWSERRNGAWRYLRWGHVADMAPSSHPAGLSQMQLATCWPAPTMLRVGPRQR